MGSVQGAPARPVHGAGSPEAVRSRGARVPPSPFTSVAFEARAVLWAERGAGGPPGITRSAEAGTFEGLQKPSGEAAPLRRGSGPAVSGLACAPGKGPLPPWCVCTARRTRVCACSARPMPARVPVCLRGRARERARGLGALCFGLCCFGSARSPQRAPGPGGRPSRLCRLPGVPHTERRPRARRRHVVRRLCRAYRGLSRDAVVKNPVSRGPEAWGMRSSPAASPLAAGGSLGPTAVTGSPAGRPAPWGPCFPAGGAGQDPPALRPQFGGAA